MGIQNGHAPEGGATGGEGIFAGEIDRLIVQLAKSEQLQTEACHASETMRLERDGWKAGAESAQQQATQLRQQLADADAQIRQFEQINDTRDELEHRNKQLQAQLDAAKNEASKTGWVVVGSHLPNREQLNAEVVRLTNNWGREIDERKALQQQVAALKASVEHEQSANRVLAGEVVKLQTQLDAAAVTPTQQPDSNAAERLEAVQRMIGEIRGWYTCTDWFDEVERADAWEQVGELLGRLQREVG